MIPSVRFKITSNIKTLASATPRISAMSTSAILFFGNNTIAYDLKSVSCVYGGGGGGGGGFVQVISQVFGCVTRIKPFLNHHCALRFFNSCIHNLFIYCSSAWGNCSNYLLSRLLLLQKRAARLLLDADYSQPSVSLFSKLKWLPIFDLIKLRKLVLLFTILNNPDSPLCLKRKFNWSAHQSLCF